MLLLATFLPKDPDGLFRLTCRLFESTACDGGLSTSSISADLLTAGSLATGASLRDSSNIADFSSINDNPQRDGSLTGAIEPDVDALRTAPAAAAVASPSPAQLSSCEHTTRRRLLALRRWSMRVIRQQQQQQLACGGEGRRLLRERVMADDDSGRFWEAKSNASETASPAASAAEAESDWDQDCQDDEEYEEGEQDDEADYDQELLEEEAADEGAADEGEDQTDDSQDYAGEGADAAGSEGEEPGDGQAARDFRHLEYDMGMVAVNPASPTELQQAPIAMSFPAATSGSMTDAQQPHEQQQQPQLPGTNASMHRPSTSPIPLAPTTGQIATADDGQRADSVLQQLQLQQLQQQQHLLQGSHGSSGGAPFPSLQQHRDVCPVGRPVRR
ncbi:MAG: hypothetical protein WDW38_006922 [Sanguina aurantia]